MAIGYRRRNDLLTSVYRDCYNTAKDAHADGIRFATPTFKKQSYIYDREQTTDINKWAGTPTSAGDLAFGTGQSYDGTTIRDYKPDNGDVVLYADIVPMSQSKVVNHIHYVHDYGSQGNTTTTTGLYTNGATLSRIDFTIYYSKTGNFPRKSFLTDPAKALDLKCEGTFTRNERYYTFTSTDTTVENGEWYMTPNLYTFTVGTVNASGSNAILQNFTASRINNAVYGIETDYPLSANANTRNYIGHVYAVKGHEKEVISAWAGMFGVPWTISLDEAKNKPIDDFSDYVPDGQPDDPDGGGDGDGDNEDDYIPDGEPDIDPAIGCSRYVLTPNQTDVFTREIWTETFINDLWRLFENPADAIISLAIFPINITAGTPAPIKIGNVQLDAIGAPLTNSIARYNMGTYTINEYYGDFNDYANTKIDLYLPYIGFKLIEPTAVVGKAITIDYVVDYSDNSVMATIRADGAFVDVARGMIGTTIPLSSTNANERMRALMSNTIGTVASVATTVANFAVGNVAGGVAGVVSSVGSAAKTAVDNKSIISSSGNVQGLSAWYAPQCVFARISRPIELTPSTYYTMMGGASAHGGTVGTFSGYTEFSTVRLNTSATSGEYNEIMRLLQGGVYL